MYKEVGGCTWVRWAVGEGGQAIPSVKTSYESKKHQLYAQTRLEDLRDVSLTLGSISDLYLPFRTLHGHHCLSHNSAQSAKLTSLLSPVMPLCMDSV